MEAIRSLTVDGIQYSVEQFSPQTRDVIKFYERLLGENEELVTKAKEVQFERDRNAAAVNHIHGVLNGLVKAELAMLQAAASATDADQEQSGE